MTASRTKLPAEPFRARGGAARRQSANGLPPMQERFCQEYVIDLNATAAAKRAGYSPRTAQGQGSMILQNLDAQAYIAQLQAKRLARTDVDSDFVLRRLLEEVNADAADLYAPNGDLKPVAQWPEAWRRGLVTTIRTTKLYGRGKDRGEEIGVQTDVVLVDRARRLELLGKHIKVNAFAERIQLGADTPLQELFRQIAGSVTRPQAGDGAKLIEHNPNPGPDDSD
jgi:phage terminase small subunit